ncbi:MAG TPA: carboxypeptidase-like regulatory domain-containing protein [Pyrinomonadaceae bacterium]
MKRKVLIAIFMLLLSAGAVSGQGESERWLRVLVTDAAGQPLKQACVTFVPREGEIVFRKADKHGKVQLKKPSMGDYRIVVKVDGYEAQKREITVGEKSESVAFALQARSY